jgi:RNA polymerase sigma-70 factor (ECF subfamily)
MEDRARQLCRGHDDASDVVQDAFERALRTASRPRDPADSTKVRAWLLAIVFHTFIDRVRKQKQTRLVTQEIELPDVADEPTQALSWQDIGDEDVRVAMAKLSEDVRETYRLFALDGLSYQEISARLSIPTSTVGTRVHRARKQLRKVLAALLEQRR